MSSGRRQYVTIDEKERSREVAESLEFILLSAWAQRDVQRAENRRRRQLFIETGATYGVSVLAGIVTGILIAVAFFLVLLPRQQTPDSLANQVGKPSAFPTATQQELRDKTSKMLDWESQALPAEAANIPDNTARGSPAEVQLSLDPLAARSSAARPTQEASKSDNSAGFPVANGIPLATLVPAVMGAPGDGPTSLSQALQKHLASTGIALAQTQGPGTYTVQGQVQMGQPASGKQSIKIEWIVLDPAGKRVGTVSQSNTVPQGSLDGPWGRTADAAAAAAAQGIIKLLPSR
jgi:hypothetical protein